MNKLNTNDFDTFRIDNLLCCDFAAQRYAYQVGGVELVHLDIEGFDLDTFDSETTEMTAHLRGVVMSEASIKFTYATFDTMVAPIICAMARGNAVAGGLCELPQKNLN